AISDILGGKKVTLDVDGQNVDLNTDKIIIERIEKEDLKVLNDGTLTVGLDTKVTDELKKEGYVRDLIRGIQNLRKESGFEVTDRIKLFVSGDDVLKDAFAKFKDFVSGETLATVQEWKDSLTKPTCVEADDKTWSISIEKA
ncbi:MAG: isoleucine--tRNA ligase, partial [Treponema sp.]|nr:isoleucine--tRNA ligase [Treponema sp.]